MSEYRLDLSIKRASADDPDEFVEIGFAGVDWDTLDGAMYALGTQVQRREWEIAGDMPDPSEVDL